MMSLSSNGRTADFRSANSGSIPLKDSSINSFKDGYPTGKGCDCKSHERPLIGGSIPSPSTIFCVSS